MVEEENDRVAQRKIDLGEEGLLSKTNELNSAMEYNEVLIFHISVFHCVFKYIILYLFFNLERTSF